MYNEIACKEKEAVNQLDNYIYSIRLDAKNIKINILLLLVFSLTWWTNRIQKI